MAFPDLNNLKSLIGNYLKEYDSWPDLPSREILEFAYNQVESCEQIVGRVFDCRTRVAVQLENALSRFEKALESHTAKRSTDETSKRKGRIRKMCESLFSNQINLEKDIDLEKEIHFFADRTKVLEEEYADELYNATPHDEDNGKEVASPDAGEDSEMVRLSNQYRYLKESLIRPSSSEFRAVSLVGMPGIGKTTLARKVFQDPCTVRRFGYRLWIKVGRKCRPEEIVEQILDEVNPDSDRLLEETARWLHESLKGVTYLIVLDDLWDKHTAAYLQTPVYSRRWNKFVQQFPDEQNGSRLLLTCRLRQVGYNFKDSCEMIEVQLLSSEESWLLLREKVFANGPCPYELEIFGRKIAEKCEGLPLTIVTVARLLAEADRTVECWREVAVRKNHEIFRTAYDEIVKVLYPSFRHLPRVLQMCFMFLVVFPPKHEIPLSTLVELWNADGFLEEYLNGLSYREMIECCLEKLASNSMAITCHSTIVSSSGKSMKSCRLHSSMWHLSNREARTSKFSHVLNSLDDAYGEAIASQHRLSFQNNVLLGIEDVRRSVEANCASTTHAFLCYAPYLQYQVPLCYGLRLLKEIDVLTIRFYEFPTEILQLANLHYLALTLNGKLPSAISMLSSLEFLTIAPHLRIKSSKESPYLPMEIWKMRTLQHLRVAGRDLPDPHGASLKRLLRLSGVSLNSCTKQVLKATPNLEKLEIQVELAPDNDCAPLKYFLRHVSRLRRLSSLTCVVVNPKVVLCSPPRLPKFPSQLTKLSLSGLGYPWQETRSIASLRHLKVLKLRNYAFRGPKWVVRKGDFPELLSLVIEDTDLMEWVMDDGRSLSVLIIKSCYKLKKIHISRLYPREIEMVDCNPLGTEQMEKILSCTFAEVKVSYSFYGK